MTTDTRRLEYWFQNTVDSVCILFFLAMYSPFFGDRITDITEIINHKWTNFLIKLILKNLAISTQYGTVVSDYKNIFI